MALKDQIHQTKPYRSVADEAFLVIQRSADRLMRTFAQMLKEQAELTPVQYNVLRIVRGAGDEGRTCGEIAERLVTADPDVTRLLDRMVKRGWIERRRCKHDRRVVRSYIAAPGSALIDQLEQPVSAFTKDQLGTIDDKRLRQLIATLEALNL
ncbi:MAG: MarR family winged helix-turn-helix transcriptional regulator [Planctomycetota bacterium]|jgi:DNA-binding MarR family transcriptional regulator|nr:MarR family winged helix-turn-helix transcriptional regulator [Planctomycetota bacterium]